MKLQALSRALMEEIIAVLWCILWAILWANEAHWVLVWIVGAKAVFDIICAALAAIMEAAGWL